MVVRGYHGTTLAAAEIILSGSEMRSSTNDGDWLGTGVYFFQDGRDRAMFWAGLQCGKTGGTPAVLEAEIDLSECLDFLDLYDVELLKLIYPDFLAEFGADPRQNPLDVRDGRVRLSADSPPLVMMNRRDKAFVDYSVEWLRRMRARNITTVRSPFLWGRAPYRESFIFNWSRVEIAVRNSALIGGLKLADVGPST